MNIELRSKSLQIGDRKRAYLVLDILALIDKPPSDSAVYCTARTGLMRMTCDELDALLSMIRFSPLTDKLMNVNRPAVMQKHKDGKVRIFRDTDRLGNVSYVIYAGSKCMGAHLSDDPLLVDIAGEKWQDIVEPGITEG